MRYNHKQIGRRIAEERKKHNFSQDDLIAWLSNTHGIGISRNTLSQIEQGKRDRYDTDFLFALCDLFDCQVGYLLCEYDDCKIYDNQFIHDKTGLSEPAIQTLIFANDAAVPKFKIAINVLNELLSLPEFTINLMNEISVYWEKADQYENAEIEFKKLPSTGSETKDLTNLMRFSQKHNGKTINQMNEDCNRSLWLANNHFFRIIEDLAKKAPDTH
jgi:transcriptional regulator with XRE-family HTH domain